MEYRNQEWLQLAQTEQEIFDELKNNVDMDKFLINMQERGILDQFLSIEAATLSRDQQISENWWNQNTLPNASDIDVVKRLATPLYVWRTANWASVVLTIRRKRDSNGQVINTGDIQIPSGLLVETNVSNPKQYMVLMETWIYEGEDYCRVLARSLYPGSEYMVAPGDLTVISKNLISDVTVTNEQTSWGGWDEETIDEIRQGALSARLSFDKVTEFGIKTQLHTDFGVTPERYNLVNTHVGPGSGAVYFDTDSDDEMKVLQDNLKLAYGILKHVGDVEIIPLYFDFDIGVAQRGDVLPNIRDQMKKDIAAAFLSFVLYNGVGKKLYLTSAANYIINYLEYKYDFASVVIKSDADSTITDVNGNIILEENQVIRVMGVVINIDTS